MPHSYWNGTCCTYVYKQEHWEKKEYKANNWVITELVKTKKMNKEELIAVYKHTKEKCADIDVPKSEKLSGIIASTSFVGSGTIIVEPMDTVSALVKYANDGKTAVLNMANAKNKGGGVERGSMAQEECLFRCSNLFMIPDEFYPMAVNEFIYTHQASFIKDVNYNTIWPVEVDVITIAAPNLNKEHKGNEISTELMEKYESIMVEKINSMLDAAAVNGCRNIILGAWGCGAFKNDPNVVARLFSEVLKGKRLFFDKVIFAVINDRNSVANNYQIFFNTFSNA